jgi:CubicO group peptidase (beta-lactamase class C family)
MMQNVSIKRDVFIFLLIFTAQFYQYMMSLKKTVVLIVVASISILVCSTVSFAQKPSLTPNTQPAKTADSLRDPQKEQEAKEAQEKQRLEQEKFKKQEGKTPTADNSNKGQDDKSLQPSVPGPIQRFTSETPSFLLDSLDSYIARGMQQWQIPGLSIVVVKDGKIELMKGYGVRSAGKPEKVDENTLFIIASNTKLFTGTSVAKLDYEGKLSLNDKVTKYIPWFKLYDSNSTRLANIRDMLSHRIGLKTFQGDFTFWDSNLPKDSIIWKMRHLKPHGEFRQDYGYCNSAFLVAGQIVEKVSGKSWEQYIQDNILAPLGMSNTYMNTAGLAERNNVASPHNNLYSNLTMLPFDSVDNLGPATSMVSNVNDLSKWLMLQLDSGKYQGRQVLPWQVLQRTRDANILTGSRKSAAFPTHFRAYGLGLYMTDYAGKQVYWHTGGAFGHVTNVCFVPEEKLGIAILTNNDNQGFFEALRYQLLDAYLKLPYTDRSKYQLGFFAQNKKQVEAGLDSMARRVANKRQPEMPLDVFTGDYYNTVYGRISVRKSGNMLICHFQHHPELLGYMEYMDNNEFRMTYSNIGYGVYPTKFFVKGDKAVEVVISMNDFVESDSYLFARDPKGMMVK